MKRSGGTGIGQKKNCDVHPTEPQPIWWGALEWLSIPYTGSCVCLKQLGLFHSRNSISLCPWEDAAWGQAPQAAEWDAEQLLAGSCLLTPLSTASSQSSLEAGVGGISHVHHTCQCKSSVILLTYLSCWENGPCSCI